jgi:hypothetical protein
VVRGQGPEFKLEYCKKEKKSNALNKQLR